MADKKRMKDQRNKPVLSEVIFRTKENTFRVSGFTKLIIKDRKGISKKGEEENIFIYIL